MIAINKDYFILKYSAIGPKANAVKNDNATRIAITAKTIMPKVAVSAFSVPALSGMYFFFASNPAIATGPMIGKKRDNNITNPHVIFQNTDGVSPNPSKPLPLLADEEVYS